MAFPRRLHPSSSLLVSSSIVYISSPYFNMSLCRGRQNHWQVPFPSQYHYLCCVDVSPPKPTFTGTHTSFIRLWSTGPNQRWFVSRCNLTILLLQSFPGSIAACAQRTFWGGAVAPGSWFAILQRLGMTATGSAIGKLLASAGITAMFGRKTQGQQALWNLVFVAWYPSYGFFWSGGDILHLTLQFLFCNPSL